MRISRNLTLILAALCFAVIFWPTAGWAATTLKNCPTEPAQNVPITSGITYSGTNCVLNTTGDVDSFIFSANAGDYWSMDVALVPGPSTNVCLTLYPPNSTTNIFYGCSDIYYGVYSNGTTMQLPSTGTYTIVVNETTTTTASYGVSLERIAPAPGDGTTLTLSKNVTGNILAISSMEAYKFSAVTTGTFEIATSIPAGSSANICFNVYQPNGSSVLTNGAAVCTDIYYGVYSNSANVTPTVAGTYVVLLFVGGDDGTVGYNLEVSCVVGECTQPPPKCSLADALSYSSGTLTMDFTLSTPVAVTWNGWLTTGNTITQLWSQSQAATQSAITVTQTASVPASGKVGVLSTLTTPSAGITCSSWETINTGKP